MNLKIKLFNSVEYLLKLASTDNLYITTSLDSLDTKEKPCSITKIPISIHNLDKLLSEFSKPVPFICSEADRYLYEWAAGRLRAPIVPKISPFLDYIDPKDGDICIKLERSTFCFELIKVTTYMECVFEDARKTPLLHNRALDLTKLSSRHSNASSLELEKMRGGTFLPRRIK